MAKPATRVLTGVKPTGIPHIGNYLGAIRPAIAMSEEPNRESFLFIADLHALTILPDPAMLTEQTYGIAATWLALGLDPKRVVFYRQSDVPEIPQLSWFLSCVLPLGLMKRAHSFKDSRQKGAQEDDIKHGLFSYPVLMAADILMFDSDIVPVGKDQKQHLEIAQEAARRFNLQYGAGETLLKVPKAGIDETVMTIPGTDGQKMSKSYGNTIPLFADEKALKRLVKGIKTDSTEFGAPLDAEGDTVFQLYRLIAGEAGTRQLAAQYASGRKDPAKPDGEFAEASENYFGWGHAKAELLELLIEHFRKPREEYTRLMADRGQINQLLDEGKDRARTVAEQVLKRVKEAAGICRS